MKVKELIKLLSTLDDNALVVTSSSSYTWGCYESILELESDLLYQNGNVYEDNKDDKDSKKNKINVVIIRS